MNLMRSLTPEQRKKVKACKNVNELTECLSEMAVALPDELLDAVAGGATYRYNDQKQCWEVIGKDGYSVLESDIRSEKDAWLNADFWSFLEEIGDI